MKLYTTYTWCISEKFMLHYLTTSVIVIGRQLVYYIFELSDYRGKLECINIFMYEKDWKRFLYFGRQLMCILTINHLLSLKIYSKP